MSTSDPDLEARLAELRPPPPREGLRAEVLAAVGAELDDAPRASWFDRLLARRVTWAAAAAALVVLVALSGWTGRARERRIGELAGRPEGAARSALRAWQLRDDLLAGLLGEGGRHE